MRVLYFSRDYTPHDHRFLSSLARSQHEVFFLRLERRGPQLEDRALPPDVTQIQWAGGRSPASLLTGPRLFMSLRDVIAAYEPELIHAGPIQTAGLLAALAGFRPLVVASWGSDLLRDADRNALWRFATTITLRRADVLIGDCETVKNKAIAFGYPADQIVTFPWGIDIEQFAPDGKVHESQAAALRSRLGWQGCFVLLSTRAWEPGYGVNLIARAFVQIARQRPELRLLLLGGGSQAALLRRIFLSGGVLERVHFAGQVSQPALPDYFRAADLYVSASRSDGSSISLLEALACATPALVSDIPGNREWINHGAQGWWFRDGDVAALSQAIDNALDAREKLPEMGQAARSLAEQRADWKRNFPKLLRAYEMALTRKDHP